MHGIFQSCQDVTGWLRFLGQDATKLQPVLSRHTPLKFDLVCKGASVIESVYLGCVFVSICVS